MACVSKWSQRFEHSGLDGLQDKAGRGRKPWLPLKKIEQVITKVTQPPAGRSRWSVRSMAQAVGISSYSVHRIWKQNDLKPHLTRTFKISNDKHFEQKFWDVVGLYLNPPDKALVLCCDEKSQCQALERTQPGLPLGIGHIRTRTHDYKRHGTVTLFAALNYLEGKIISRTESKHTHVEWLRFLRQIHRETPKELDVHLIVDNYSTHKHQAVKEWLSQHPRFHAHPHRQFLDELGGALLRRLDPRSGARGKLRQCGGAGTSDHGLPGAEKRASEAIRLEGAGGTDPGQAPPGQKGAC
jgi:transposase